MKGSEKAPGEIGCGTARLHSYLGFSAYIVEGGVLIVGAAA